MSSEHYYKLKLTWTGAKNGPAQLYTAYSREFQAEYEGKPTITGSADPSYRGDASLPNPEELLVTAIASCHMLTYIALCCRSKFDVVTYVDEAEGIMQLVDGKMAVTDVVLRPVVTLAAGADEEKAKQLHQDAHDQCFITNSVKCDVAIQPKFTVLQ